MMGIERRVPENGDISNLKYAVYCFTCEEPIPKIINVPGLRKLLLGANLSQDEASTNALNHDQQFGLVHKLLIYGYNHQPGSETSSD